MDKTKELNSCPPGMPENTIPESLPSIAILNFGYDDFFSEDKVFILSDVEATSLSKSKSSFCWFRDDTLRQNIFN